MRVLEAKNAILLWCQVNLNVNDIISQSQEKVTI